MLRKLTAALVVPLMLAGCAGPLSLATAPPGLTSEEDFPRCLIDRHVIPRMPTAKKADFVAIDAALVKALYRRPLPLASYSNGSGYVAEDSSALSGYLDCLLGEAAYGNGSAQLLRGHVMLTLLAQYGAEIVRAGRTDRQPSQALRLISHIREAELLLAAGADALALPDAPLPPHLGEFWFAARIASVLQVAIDVETVYARRSLDTANNLLAALGGGPAAAGQAQRMLADAGRGLALTQRSRLYGAAFIADSRASMATIGAVNSTSDGHVVAAQWGLWSARLDAACADLAAAAKLSDPSCRPTQSAVTALRVRMGGATPFRIDPPTPAATMSGTPGAPASPQM